MMRLAVVVVLGLFACSSERNEGSDRVDAGETPDDTAGSSGASAEAGAQNGGAGRQNGSGGGGGSDTGSAGDAGSGEGGSDPGDGGSEAGGQAGAGGMSGEEMPDGGGSGPSLDECFEGLREPVGSFQDAEKASADGMYRFRLALETGDRFGTSGTRPWAPIRLALVTPDGTFCVTDEVALADAYAGTRHNCGDVLTWVEDGRRYVIENPDTAIDLVNPTVWVRPASLTVFEGDEVIAGPIRLDTVECHRSSSPRCPSGGPCP